MSADFIESTILPDGADAQAWWLATADALKAKGATFMRWSYPEDKPNHLYLEGWRERPKEQGPHPWERDAAAAVDE